MQSHITKTTRCALLQNHRVSPIVVTTNSRNIHFQQLCSDIKMFICQKKYQHASTFRPKHSLHTWITHMQASGMVRGTNNSLMIRSSRKSNINANAGCKTIILGACWKIMSCVQHLQLRFLSQRSP